MTIRHRSRHLLGTLFGRTQAGLTAAGWITPPINFSVDPLVLLDYQPMERGEEIAAGTVAVSLGESPTDEDGELGAGFRTAWYPLFVDVYMPLESHILAICDDIRDLYDSKRIQLVDQSTATPVPGWWIDIQEVMGPEKASAFVGAQNFKLHWRTMKIGCSLEYVP